MCAHRSFFWGLFLAVGITASAQAASCLQTDIHESPVNGGIKFPVHVERATGNVPFLKAAYRRPGGEWLDDSLDYNYFPDNYSGDFPINDPSKFAGIPGKTFLVRFYGYYSDGGTPRPFQIHKDCTANQTRILYFNDYDHYPNVIVLITWDKPYAAEDVFRYQISPEKPALRQHPFGLPK